MSGYMLELFFVPNMLECENPIDYNCTPLIEIYIFKKYLTCLLFITELLPPYIDILFD